MHVDISAAPTTVKTINKSAVRYRPHYSLVVRSTSSSAPYTYHTNLYSSVLDDSSTIEKPVALGAFLVQKG